MDLYHDDGDPNALRREVLRITASDDIEAISEANRISGWRQPVRYEVRAIAKAARANHRLVHASVVVEPALDEAVQRPASSAGAESLPDADSSPQRDGLL